MVLPVKYPQGIPPSPPLVSRAFFGMTHQVDNLLDWVSDILFHFRHGKDAVRSYSSFPSSSNEALEDIRRMLTKKSQDNETDDGIPKGFKRDISRTAQVTIGNDTYLREQSGYKCGKAIISSVDLAGEIHSKLEEFLGKQGALNLERLFHQGLPAKTLTDIAYSSSRMPVRKSWSLSVQKKEPYIELSYTQLLDLKKPGAPAHALTETRSLLIPLDELCKEMPLSETPDLTTIIPHASSQVTYSFQGWRPFKHLPPIQDHAFVTRSFNRLFSYTLYPVVNRIQSCFNRLHA